MKKLWFAFMFVNENTCTYKVIEADSAEEAAKKYEAWRDKLGNYKTLWGPIITIKPFIPDIT